MLRRDVGEPSGHDVRRTRSARRHTTRFPISRSEVGARHGPCLALRLSCGCTTMPACLCRLTGFAPGRSPARNTRMRGGIGPRATGRSEESARQRCGARGIDFPIRMPVDELPLNRLVRSVLRSRSGGTVMRTIGFLMVLSGLLASVNADANVPLDPPTSWRGVSGAQIFPTPEAAALSFIAHLPPGAATLGTCGTTPMPVGGLEFLVFCTYSGPPGIFCGANFICARGDGTCPPNSTLTTIFPVGSCACNFGFTEVNGTCSRTNLSLSLSPNPTDIWPANLGNVLPRTRQKNDVTHITATVIDGVSGSPQAGELVRFNVSNAVARGHDHTNPAPPAAGFTASCQTDIGGSCTVTFSSEVSGTYTISASLASDPSVTATASPVTVRIDGLQGLSAPFYLLTGQFQALRCDGFSRVTSQHSSNHFVDQILSSELESIGRIFNGATGQLMRVNDTSLEWGGLFDFDNIWTPPHTQHRVGIHADVEINSDDALGLCSPLTAGELKMLKRIIRLVQGRSPVNEGDHLHLNRSLGN